MTARMSRGTATVLSRMLPPEERAGYVETMAPVRSGARVAAGHVARDAGAAFEAWLAAQHQAASVAGLAYVRHVGPPVAHTGAGGRELKIVGTGPADFQGVMCGGRALAIEAKSREGRLARAEIPEHQQRDLARVAALGGVALLVVELREHQLVAAVPWRDVPWKVARTAEAVGAAELGPWRVDASRCYLERFARAT